MGDDGGETAAAGDNPDEDTDGERLRGTGGELTTATPVTVGELTPLLAGTREAFAAQGAQFQARVELAVSPALA